MPLIRIRNARANCFPGVFIFGHIHFDLPSGTVFDLRKPAPFLGCLISPNTTKVNPRCSLPPGAESTHLNRIREEVCGLSSKPQRKRPPLRQFKPQHHRLFHSTHPRPRASEVPAHVSLRVWVQAWRSRDTSPAKKTCRSTVK